MNKHLPLLFQFCKTFYLFAKLMQSNKSTSATRTLTISLVHISTNQCNFINAILQFSSQKETTYEDITIGP